jgi:hypothetical protein
MVLMVRNFLRPLLLIVACLPAVGCGIVGSDGGTGSASELDEICAGVEEFLTGYTTGVILHQCEVQSGRLITQTNYFTEWDSLLQEIAADELPIEAVYEAPAAAISSAIFTAGADPNQFVEFIHSYREPCETVLEFTTADIAAAVDAIRNDLEEWRAAVLAAVANAGYSRLTDC